MRGWLYEDFDPRPVQCPVCERVFHSGKWACQCSKCGFRFNSESNPFKTSEDRKEERKLISDLLVQIKQKNAENEENMKQIERLLMPI